MAYIYGFLLVLLIIRDANVKGVRGVLAGICPIGGSRAHIIVLCGSCSAQATNEFPVTSDRRSELSIHELWISLRGRATVLAPRACLADLLLCNAGRTLSRRNHSTPRCGHFCACAQSAKFVRCYEISRRSDYMLRNHATHVFDIILRRLYVLDVLLLHSDHRLNGIGSRWR